MRASDILSQENARERRSLAHTEDGAEVVGAITDVDDTIELGLVPLEERLELVA